MRHLTVLLAAAITVSAASIALAQSAGDNRISGPENPANARRAVAGTPATTGAQSAHQNPTGTENPANIRPGSPSKKKQ